MNLADKLSDNLVETDSGCWEFVGGRTGSNYGVLYVGNGTCVSAHRLSYEIEYGPIPKGMFVCHTCDNPPCCNPNHLFVGSLQDNKVDEVSKGRHVYGEKVGNHKLFIDDVKAIRLLIKEGYSLSYIGNKFGVTRQAIYRIKAGLCWEWLK